MNQFENIADNASRLRHRAARWLASVSAVLLLSACAMHANDLVPDQDKVGVSIGAVGHYGSMIGIPTFTVDGQWGGNNTGWGGGGAGLCCVLLPRTVTKPVIVMVKWETCDINHIKYVNHRKVDPDARCTIQEHEATVPIHFAVQPGDSSGLYVHFLPRHKVEAWVSWPGPASTKYPGPKYPFGPPPPYAPLPDEKPASSTDNDMTR